MFQFKVCFFCELPIGDYEDSVISYKNFWICDGGTRLNLSLPYLRLCKIIREKISTIREEETCTLCYEKTTCMELPNCKHRLCLQCIKTIYFGFSKEKRPQHWGELPWPEWPHEIDECHFEDYLCQTVKNRFLKYNHSITIHELKQQRDLRIPTRPAWMNQKAFIDYEDKQFRYFLETRDKLRDYSRYEMNKIKGNKKCPYCRA